MIAEHHKRGPSLCANGGMLYERARVGRPEAFSSLQWFRRYLKERVCKAVRRLLFFIHTRTLKSRSYFILGGLYTYFYY